jgi:hypothetical protein
MALDIPCPYCGAAVPVPAAYLGGAVRCPRCAMVIPVELTGLTADEPSGARAPSWPSAPGAIQLPERKLSRADRYQRGRGPLLLALGLSSVGVSVLGMVAGGVLVSMSWVAAGLLCSAPVLFGPPAFALGLAAWVMGQHDMEKLRRAVIDPDADRMTRGGWICGMIGTILGVLMTLCGACGGLVLLRSATSNP